MPACGTLESSRGILMCFGCGMAWASNERLVWGLLFTQLSPTQANEVMSKPWLGPSCRNHPFSLLATPSLRVTHTLQLGPEGR